MSDEGYEVGNARVIVETDKAIKVKIDGVGKVWIPKSQIVDSSEVWKAGQEGMLIVTAWLAEQQSWL